MDSIDTIVVPTDGSSCAAGVVRQAAGLASQVGARLVVLHAVEPPAGLKADSRIQVAPDRSVSVLEHLREGASAWLPDLVQIGRDRGVDTVSELRTGGAVEAILDAASHHDADLLVLGTHGRTGVARLLLGSVAESVLRRADVPVMTVRSQHQPSCAARSCATCTEHVSPELSAARAELDG